MYKAIEFFTDAQDNDYAYNVGDVYPRQGLSVSDKRLAELASDANKRHKPMIKAEAEPVIAEKVEADRAVEIEPQKPKKRGKKNADGDMSRDQKLV